MDRKPLIAMTALGALTAAGDAAATSKFGAQQVVKETVQTVD